MTIEELGEKLRETSTKIAYYQAIGRAKDPEVKIRSIIYCWGISGGREPIDSPGVKTAMDLMTFDDDVPTPQIFKATQTIARTEFITKVGKIWMDDGIKINEFVGRFVGIMKKHNQLTHDWLSQRDLRRKFSISVGDLDWFLEQNSPAVLGKVGITIEDHKRTRRFRYEERIDTTVGKI